MQIEYSDKKYKYIRTGECNRCGQCCIDKKCLHFVWVKGVATCLIYNKRDQDCEECSAELIRLGKAKRYNHKVCINFSNHPFLHCLKSGKCGYNFIRKKK